MPISSELAVQILDDSIFQERKIEMSFNKTAIFGGLMTGELYLTKEYLMFLCEKPHVSSKGGSAAKFGLGLVTLGWSHLVTDAIDNSRAKKIQKKLDHPYSFLIPISNIIRYERKKGSRLTRWDGDSNHFRFDVVGEEVEEIPIFLTKGSLDTWEEAFASVADSFNKINPTETPLETDHSIGEESVSTNDERINRLNFCSNCGFKIINQDIFCTSCGSEIDYSKLNQN